MTFEEAKKILEKEGFELEKRSGITVGSIGEFPKWEKIAVKEAMIVIAKNSYVTLMDMSIYEARKARLEKEYEKNTKAPVSGKEQPKEKKGIIYPTTFPKADFYHKHVLNEGNPALAESASQFNDALLDEQAKKIAELTKEKSNLEGLITILNAYKKHNDKINRKQIKGLGKEIARLNGIIHKKNLKIEELRKESSRHLRGKIKMFGENVDLEQMLKDKNAVLSDVAEELRLTKIREKNLVGVSQKYMKENEELKKELADKVVDKIDAQALKSAESALAWKEKVIAEKDEVIDKLTKENNDYKKVVDGINANALKSALACKEQLIYYKDKIIANNKKKIADLGKELEKMTKLVETVRKGSKEYCDYGIAAEKMIQKMAKEIVNDSPVPSKDYEQYRLWANGCRFNPHLPDFSEEEEMKLQKKACVDIAEEGKDHSAIIVQYDNGITLSKEEAEIIERCTKNGTELHYSEKDGLTYTNVFGEEMPIRCLRGIFHAFTDEEIENMKK
jgi:hypothetical protein